MAEMQRWKNAGAIFAEDLGSSNNRINYNTPTVDSPYGKSRVFSGGTGYGHSLKLTVNRLSVSFKVKLTGNWYKCCLVRDASLNKYIFYIGNSTYTYGPVSPVINVATTTVSVGGISGLHNKHMKIPIKRFAIFNKALSASEAQLLTT